MQGDFSHRHSARALHALSALNEALCALYTVRALNGVDCKYTGECTKSVQYMCTYMCTVFITCAA